MFALKRRRHGDEIGVGLDRHGRGPQIAAGHGGFHHLIQIRLNDMDLTPVNGIDGILININAHDLLLTRGEGGDRRQANVAEANNGDS